MREMKDSGVEWIGEIPKDWKCCKQKNCIKLINGRAYSENEFEESGKYRVLRVGNLFSNPVWYYSNMELSKDKYCEKGDLLYSWSMSYSPFIWSGEKIIFHYHIWKLKLDDNLFKNFVYYYLVALTDSLKSEIHETTMGFITMGIMNNSYFSYPTYNEQILIANYLDKKCSEIDSLTQDIRQQISQFGEYKKSVITEAVTKGLNPNVEMKDSGIECIRYIPVHWKIKKLKRVALCINGDRGENYPSGTDLIDEGIPFISSNNIHDLVLNCESVETKFITEKKYKILKGAKLEIDDLVFCLRGSVGLCSINKNLKKGTIASSLVVIRAKDINADYLNYFFNSAISEIQTSKLLNGACAVNLSAENLQNYYLVIPDIKNQINIVNYLNKKTNEINGIINLKKQQLSKLEEYKKSLIYEYVTGKKRSFIENEVR